MEKPLFIESLELAEKIVVSRAHALDQSPEEILSFAWRLAEAYDLKVVENLKDWDLWFKEQYRLAERNRPAVRAAQTHCVYCEQPLDGTSHMDHIKAIKNGGSGEITNLVYACDKCNLSKNGQDFRQFTETKTKTIQSQIIRRLEKLGKQIPVKLPPPEEVSSNT
jgi:5-methylcytosine-specific restriction endonuclease McrA